MSGLKTFLLGLFLCQPAMADTTPLAPQPGEELLYQFASCTGRFSALVEHQWMFDGDASEITIKEMQAMASIVDAILAADQGRRALNWRIEAKVAYRHLLSLTVFGPQTRGQIALKLRADRMLSDCRALLLG